MNVTPFHQFIDFVQCDDTITACLHSQASLNRDISHLNEEKVIQNQLLEKECALVRSLRKQLDTYELESKSLQQQKKQTEKKLEHVANPKEFHSLQAEYQQITQKLETLEEKMMAAWETLEKEQDQCHQAEQKDAHLRKEFADREKVLQEQLANSAENLTQLREERNAKAKLVKPEWLEKYESLKSHVANPVVAVKEGSCSGCFTKVPPQVAVRVHRHELVPCPTCQRILYEV